MGLLRFSWPCWPLFSVVYVAAIFAPHAVFVAGLCDNCVTAAACQPPSNKCLPAAVRATDRFVPQAGVEKATQHRHGGAAQQQRSVLSGGRAGPNKRGAGFWRRSCGTKGGKRPTRRLRSLRYTFLTGLSVGGAGGQECAPLTRRNGGGVFQIIPIATNQTSIDPRQGKSLPGLLARLCGILVRTSNPSRNLHQSIVDLITSWSRTG